MDTQTRGRGTQFLLSAACFIVVVAGLKAASALILPFLLALFLSILCSPLLGWLKRRHLPDWLAVPLTVAALLLALTAVPALVGGSANQFRAKLPGYQERLDDLSTRALSQLDSWNFDISESLAQDQLSPGMVLEYVNKVISTATVMMSNFALVLLSVVFILAEAAGFPDKLRQAFGHNVEGVQRVAAITSEVQTYFGIKTVLSLATGLVAGVFLGVLGIDFFILWAFLTFLLNYVPNIGSIMAAIPPVLLAMVQYGPGYAVAVAVAYLAINMVIGNVIEPRLMGRRLGLSTLVVFISLCFWGWVWGPVGMLLSVPLTMFVKILLENSGDLQWLAVLLSGETDARPGGA